MRRTPLGAEDLRLALPYPVRFLSPLKPLPITPIQLSINVPVTSSLELNCGKDFMPDRISALLPHCLKIISTFTP